MQYGEQRQAQKRAENGADAAHQAGAAEHDGRNHIKLLAHEHRRRDGLCELRLDQRGDAGHDAHVAIDQHVEAENVEAEPLRGIGIAAHGVDLPTDIGAVEQEPGDEKGRRRARGSAD